jgi:cyclic pyranopterin phosphate synthase
MDLRDLLRSEADPEVRAAKLEQAIIDSMDLKPEKHHFDLANEPQILRFMNATGG